MSELVDGLIGEQVQTEVETPTPAVGTEVQPEPAATPEPEKPKETVPLATFLEVKKSRKAIELQLAEERGRRLALEEMTKGKVEEPALVIDPLANLNDEDVLTKADLKRLDESRAQQEAAQTQQQIAQQRIADAQESYQAALVEFAAEKTGEGLDLLSVINAGEKNLTAGDKVDIANGGKKAMQIAYERCLQRTPELAAKIIKPTPPVVPKVETEPKQPDTPAAETGPNTPAKKLVAFLTT